MYKIIAINGDKETIIHEDTENSIAFVNSCKFTESVNEIPTAEFTITPLNPAYSDGLHDRKTIIKIINTKSGSTSFEGFLLQTSQEMSSDGKVYKSCTCEGFLGCLCDTIQPYHNYDNTTAEEFITATLSIHNSMTSPDKHISLGMCNISGDNTNSKTTAYRSTLQEIKTNLMDRLGGEIRIRNVSGNLVLDYLTSYGSESSTTIELAKNIRSLNVSTDSTTIVTRLIPLGAQLDSSSTSAERLTIASVNNNCIYIDDASAISKFGIIVGTIEFDDITDPSNLIIAGQKYLQNNNKIKKSYSAEILDLSTINPSESEIIAGNTYHFKNAFMGIDENLRLIKRTVDIYTPYKPIIEIGDKAERITDIAARTEKLIQYDLPQQKSDILASAKATATALINAGINGYVVVNSNEILIMDTPDKTTAAKVWRWNSGGFGYSSTGYNGTYGTAITMDGAITADFITAGVLRGLEISNGNGTFHVGTDGSVTASAFNMTGGNINLSADSELNSLISMKYNQYSIRIAPVEWVVKNTDYNCQILCQGHTLYFYSDLSEPKISAYISSRDGTSTFTKTYSNDFLYKNDDSDTGYFSLRDTINLLKSRISALESK